MGERGSEIAGTWITYSQMSSSSWFLPRTARYPAIVSRDPAIVSRERSREREGERGERKLSLIHI
eukprot:1678213-Rhodomonas_salina.2